MSGTSAAVYTRLHGRARPVTPPVASSTAPATSVTTCIPPYPTPIPVTRRTSRVDLDRLSVPIWGQRGPQQTINPAPPSAWTAPPEEVEMTEMTERSVSVPPANQEVVLPRDLRSRLNGLMAPCKPARSMVTLNARTLAAERRRARRSGPISADLGETSFNV